MIEVLKFSMTSCSPCKVVAKQLENLPLKEIDIDEDVDGLFTKYKIRNVPTLVFLKDGEEVDRHSGLITREGYLQKVNTLENGE